ncbi:MAG TPA: hypothetical protein VKZ99_03455 [Gammaproteobacteria bacterium]|nr:hypothetical protein [Gammaproteobacteria bacterium]
MISLTVGEHSPGHIEMHDEDEDDAAYLAARPRLLLAMIDEPSSEPDPGVLVEDLPRQVT